MMMRYLLKRFSIAVAILLVMSSLLFVLSRTEDPRYRSLSASGHMASPEQREAWGEELGLNRPLIVQYVDWIADSMRIDFGNSIERRIPARGIALEHATETSRLLVGALGFAVIFSTAAILAIRYISERGPDLEYVGRLARVIVPAIPPFIPGILLAHIFYPHSLLFPIIGNGAWSHVLPSAALGMVIAYVVVRLFDAARNDDADSDNTPENLVANSGPGRASSRPIAWHMLLNLLRTTRVYLPVLLAAVLFTELFFEMHGLSNLISPILLSSDFPLAASIFMVLTMAYVAVILMLDVARAFVDPLIRGGGGSDDSSTYSALVAGVRPVPLREWPLFGRRPLIAVTILGMIVLFSVIVPFIVNYRGDLTGTDWLYRIFLSFRIASLTLAFALIAAAIFGATAALTANRYGGMIDSSLVWLFDLFTSFPILLLGLAGFFAWVQTFIFSFLFSYASVYVQVSTYPAALLAVIVSGMFFHQIRTDARMSLWREGVFNRQFVIGILTVAALSAGPLVMLGAIFDVAGVYGASGWGGPFGRAAYSLASIWWTLLAGLVLILTVLSLNFLGEWLRERYDPPPPPADSHNTQAEFRLRPERPGEPSKSRDIY